MDRYLSAAFAGAAAFFLARGVGLPVWQNWPADWKGDATDIGVLTFLAVLYAIDAVHP